MDKLNELSLCAGIAGISLGLRQTGKFRTVCYSEIEANCVKILKGRIKDGLLDDAPIWGDLIKFNGRPWRGRVDIITGGFPCFPVGTPILTDSGFTTIEDIVIGDNVWTHNKRFKRVVQTMSRDCDKLIKIKAMGSPEFFVTPEHPFYVRCKKRIWNNSTRSYKRVWNEPEWIEAKNLNNNYYLAQPIISSNENGKLTKELSYIIGRYLGDGWIINHNRKNRKNSKVWNVIICAKKGDESEKLLQYINAAGFHATEAEERTVTKFHINSKNLVLLLQQFGKYSYGKFIPNWIFKEPIEIQKQLFDGYVDSDGCIRKDGTISITTVSKNLAIGIAQVGRNVFERGISINFKKVPEFTMIEGRKVSQRPQYCVLIFLHNREAFVENGFVWVPIRKIEETRRRI